MNVLIETWSRPPEIVRLRYPPAAEHPPAGTTVGADKHEAPLLLLPSIGPGRGLYARTLHAVDSDYPGPVLLELLEPPLAGAVASGAFTLVGERLVLRLDRLEYRGRSVSIDAWAVGLDCACYGVAGEVAREGRFGFGALAIVRIVVAVALMAPLPGGMNGAQHAVVGLAHLGGDFANAVWQPFSEEALGHARSMGQDQRGAVGTLVGHESCFRAGIDGLSLKRKRGLGGQRLQLVAALNLAKFGDGPGGRREPSLCGWLRPSPKFGAVFTAPGRSPPGAARSCRRRPRARSRRTRVPCARGIPRSGRRCAGSG